MAEGAEPLEAVEGEAVESETPVESVGGDEVVESQREQRRRRFIRRYKIQEVIKRGQIMLVQVVKEERGNKGAALTTYLSLAGRYCVLMPNTDKGGGISRKITSMQDRRRMKDLLDQLEIPDGMACILRTAGMERSKVEVKRDLEYLLRLWDSIRENTLKSIAPSVIYEEANLIKRAMRDLYTPDLENILVEGDEGYTRAKEFMRMLMPTHARRVQHYRDPVIPLFFRYQVENQINGLHSPVVQLRSGGYIVINQTEALVAIDVNSGRATRERNIEETALRTNLEAAEEIARQLRLRDLAGLIVIDFIDMEDGRNNAAVERRIKDAMRHDRARLQIGRISHFGLLELSRQRLRPSLLELNFEKCPHCQGTGYTRLVEATAVLALHAVEEEGIRQNAAEISLALPTAAAHYIMNNKRDLLAGIERRYGMTVKIKIREDVIPPDFPIERMRTKRADEQLPMNMGDASAYIESDPDAGLPLSPEEAEFMAEEGMIQAGNENAGSDESFGAGYDNGPRGEGRGRRRRGRRGGRRRGGQGGPRREGFEQDNNAPREPGNEMAPAVFGEEPNAGNIEEVDGNRADYRSEPREGGEGRGPRSDRGGDRERGGRRRHRGGRGGRDRHRGERGERGDRPERNNQQGGYAAQGAPEDNRGNYAPQQSMPANVLDLDTTPRDEKTPSASQSLLNQGLDVPQEKKKSGWWQRLTGA